MYEVNGWSKFAEKDSIEDGCDPDSTVCTSGTDTFYHINTYGLIDRLKEFVGQTSDEDVLINYNGDKGRINIQVMETYEGVPARRNLIERWRKGEVKYIWAATYTFHIEYVIRTTEWIEKGTRGYTTD